MKQHRCRFAEGRTPEQTQVDIESVNRCLNPLSLYTTADILTDVDDIYDIFMPDICSHCFRTKILPIVNKLMRDDAKPWTDNDFSNWYKEPPYYEKEMKMLDSGK